MSRFIEQLNRDIRFLCQHGIVDYSILIGIQPNPGLMQESIEDEEKKSGKHFAHLVSSINR